MLAEKLEATNASKRINPNAHSFNKSYLSTMLTAGDPIVSKIEFLS